MPRGRWRLSDLRPHQLLVLGFASCTAVGTALLMLPASARGDALSWHEALFTATSAVCVTGLTVVDTGSRLSALGQLILLLLIQVGGLGIMAFSTFFLFAARARPSLAAVEATGQSMGVMPGDLRSTLRSIVPLVFVLEAIGAAVLFVLFAHGDGRPTGGRMWESIFLSVSAFCNAGFALRADSLQSYRDSWAVCLVFMVLITTGGIGFPVLRELGISVRAWMAGVRRAPVSLHAKMALSVSALLFAAGAVAFAIAEWSNPESISGLSVHAKVLAAIFQSVTARTAGFCTVRIETLAPATLLFLIFLMFVGASPCSTGGGIKTTTLGVAIVSVVSGLRGREEPCVFGRSIPKQVVSRAFMVLTLSTILVLSASWLMLLVEGKRFGMMAAVFETVSAFGTVGLSTGITPELGVPARLLLIVLMFAGRLGPLTLVLSVAGREGPDRINYPSEPLLVG